jgi:hypothetical protein
VGLVQRGPPYKPPHTISLRPFGLKGNSENLRPWKKGTSGNPGGRPRGYADARKLAQSHSATAIRTLTQLMRHSKSDRIRVMCAEAILDRAWGRPAISVLHADVSEQPLTRVLDEGTPEQQWDRIREVCQILVDCGAVRVLPAGSAPVGKDTDALPH